ncbi:hypothetical protein C8J56DRAFT_384874 [Mycena floridula]|nr:hypothetical protein C8J56DRAFT_384874 [Mycena floridula]
MLFAVRKSGLVEEDGMETTGTSLDVRQGPWVLSHVSQMWREEILSRPSIWADIDVYYPPIKDESNYPMMVPYRDIFDCIFSRAKDFPLHMRFRLYFLSDAAYLILYCGFQYRTTRLALQDLTLIVEPELLSARGRKSLPGLKTVRRQTTCDTLIPCQILADSFEKAIALTHLSLVGFHDFMALQKFPCTQITHFSNEGCSHRQDA